ncbi:MAG: hypothetical protein GIW98_01880 [Candidatus Eremiobacteraeota bacterium]|nr:hypothetical protein [Candidatus Eremiobacteraeota bacterium]
MDTRGDGINGIMGAFGRIGNKLDFIQVRYEEMAAFMAAPTRSVPGGRGSAWATSRPEQVHLLYGLYDEFWPALPHKSNSN